MTDFPLHTIDTAPEGSRATLRAAKAAWGFVPNLHAKLAEAPIAVQAYDRMFALVAEGTLTPAEQQVVYLTANVLHECEYCTAGHTVLAGRAGLDAASIAALREGGALPDARLQALHGFTRAVILGRGRVAPQEVEAFLAAGFTRAQVLEILVAIAAKTISNYANRLAGTPLESFMTGDIAWVAPSRRRQDAA
jgi:AhpD family alkylhydroperoxidase